MTTSGKADGSPVTEADLAADRVIADGLARLIPEVQTLSEERTHLVQWLEARRETRAQACGQLIWALATSAEFRFNH